jgi:hypothetical protein
MTRTRKKAVVGNVAAPALLSDITKLGGGIDPKEKKSYFFEGDELPKKQIQK